MLNVGIVDYARIDPVVGYSLGIYLNMAMWIVALTTIAFIACKSGSSQIYLLLLSSILLAVFFSSNSGFLFYLLSSLLLTFICVHFFQNYRKNPQKTTLLVLVAFIFLLFGKIHFLFSLDHGTYYVIGHILELVAYSLIFTNLLLVIRHDKKA